MPEPIEITNMKNNCDNREYVIEAVKVQGSLLEFASEELRNDKEIVLTAIQSNPEALEFASDNLKSDRDVVFESVSNVRLDVLLCKRESFIRQRTVDCRIKE